MSVCLRLYSMVLCYLGRLSLHLQLMTTAHCTLCDKALDMLFDSGLLSGVMLSTIDVAEDDALMAEYGEHIPVLRCGQQTLRWPFTAKEAAELIQALE